MGLSKRARTEREIVRAARAVAAANPGLCGADEIVEAVEEELGWVLTDAPGGVAERSVAYTAYQEIEQWPRTGL